MTDTQNAAPQPVDILVAGCDIVTLDDAGTIIRDGAIAVSRGRIVWMGKADDADALFRPETRLDGSDRIAMPGLIDGHMHTAQQLLRGKIFEMQRKRALKIPIWKNYYIPFEGMLTHEDVELSGLVAYTNMISVGTTCFAEAGGPHPDAMGQAALDVGIAFGDV